jgi:arylsulfatase A-like enzyme
MPERELYGESMYPSRFGWSPLRMVRDTRLKYIDAPRPELYDLEADPFEQHDISSQRPLVVAGMRARLDAIGAEKRAGIPGSSPSDETLRALASLGYVSGRTAAPPSSALDPKDFIQAFNLRSTAR